MASGLAEPAGSSSPHHAPIERWRWGVVWLMFLATTLAYMDRQTLASTAVPIVNEFHLTKEGYGWVEFWFALTFALFQIPAGFVADRWSVRWLYGGALLLWSAAGFLTGMAHTVFLLSACRFVLGIGEAFNWPCAVGIVRRIIPLESRGFANGIFHSGASLGAALTPLLAMMLMGERGENWALASFGAGVVGLAAEPSGEGPLLAASALIARGTENWRLLFQVVGAGGLVWAVMWLVFVRGQRARAMSAPPLATPEGEIADRVASPPFARIFKMPQFWITLAVGIAVNICWHFYRIWLTLFLNVDLGFSQRNIQWVLIGFFIAADLGSLASGYLTRRLTDAGYSVERSRKLVLLGSSLLCLLSTPAALLLDPWLTLPLVFVVAAGSMAGFPVFFALSQAISPRHTSLCLGIFGCAGWLCIAGLNPPIGALVDRIGTFAPSLIAVGFVPLVGALIALWWPEPLPDASAKRR